MSLFVSRGLVCHCEQGGDVSLFVSRGLVCRCL